MKNLLENDKNYSDNRKDTNKKNHKRFNSEEKTNFNRLHTTVDRPKAHRTVLTKRIQLNDIFGNVIVVGGYVSNTKIQNDVGVTAEPGRLQSRTSHKLTLSSTEQVANW
uniref:Uncharacterized protein n=1 Tax=Romanomermis culicivorax TaxID=13658 RepID=A0A915J292_ROMCU